MLLMYTIMSAMVVPRWPQPLGHIYVYQMLTTTASKHISKQIKANFHLGIHTSALAGPRVL